MMKNKLRIVLILLLVLITIPNVANAKDNLDLGFSITPDSTEWSNYNAYELQEKLNIPREQVDTLNTGELLELVLNYPFIGDVYAFNTVDDGLETIRQRFEPLDELLKREDISEVVYLKYLDNRYTDIAKKELVNEEYETSLKINILEILLEKDEVYAQLTDSQINQIVKKAVDIENEINIESEFAQEGSEFKDNFDKEALARSAGVYTPRGSYVSVLVRGEQLSSGRKNQINSHFDKTYPKATRLRSATTNYNCHSYAWYSTSSNNKYWMNDPSPYKTDGSYRNVGFLPTASGQKLYYPVSGGHSAIVNSTGSSIWDVNMTSKWGEAGLYRHNYGNDPYSVGPLNITNWKRN